MKEGLWGLEMEQKVKVKLFSLYADAVNKSEVEVLLKQDGRVSELLYSLIREYPALSKAFTVVKPIVLINGVPASEDQLITESSEVAVVPPSAGG
ncbi:MAG: MoaD/ThiS family protein [Desulfurococcaceae archaeon]